MIEIRDVDNAVDAIHNIMGGDEDRPLAIIKSIIESLLTHERKQYAPLVEECVDYVKTMDRIGVTKENSFYGIFARRVQTALAAITTDGGDNK
jgi:dTDP-D-glucose 4,6-dehydratase